MDHEPDEPPVEFGNALQWREVDEDDERRLEDPGHVRRVRLLVAACVVGGLVIVAITVLAVRGAVREIDRRTTANPVAIRASYDVRFRACLAGATAPAVCAQRTSEQCSVDSRWGATPDPRVVLDHCVFRP